MMAAAKTGDDDHVGAQALIETTYWPALVKTINRLRVQLHKTSMIHNEFRVFLNISHTAKHCDFLVIILYSSGNDAYSTENKTTPPFSPLIVWIVQLIRLTDTEILDHASRVPLRHAS